MPSAESNTQTQLKMIPTDFECLSAWRKNEDKELTISYYEYYTSLRSNMLKRRKTLYTDLNFKRWSNWSISLHNLPLFVHQKLGEVPFDSISKDSSFLWFEELVKGSCILPINLNLRIPDEETSYKVSITIFW